MNGAPTRVRSLLARLAKEVGATLKFDPSQARDDQGQWTESGGGGGSGAGNDDAGGGGDAERKPGRGKFKDGTRVTVYPLDYGGMAVDREGVSVAGHVLGREGEQYVVRTDDGDELYIERDQLEVEKAAFVAAGDFTKLDEDRRLAFGWAYVTEDDGQVSVDHSGDFIDKAALPALEEAAYDYVLTSRQADEMHEKLEGVAEIVESFMLTPEKAAAMGIVTKRYGYWIGFKVQDEAVWAKVKDGTYKGFSIRGSGEREKAA